jgi:putative membrane protein
MKLLSDVLVGVVAAIHAYIVVLEMLLWQKPIGRRVFGTTAEQAAQTATLAANQGLYNGFLAAGLIWSLVGGDELRRPVATFFLLCVAVAGLFGAATVSRRILFVQTLPAVLALLSVWLVPG